MRRSRGSVPPSFWYRFPHSFPSVPCGIHNLRHHWTFSSLMGTWLTCKLWCIVSLNTYYLPAQVHVRACRTWCSLPLRGSGGRSPYHPPPRGCGGSPNVPSPSYLQVSPLFSAAGLLRGWILRLFHPPRRLALIPYCVRQISGVSPPFEMAYPPIPELKSTTPLSLPFSESPQIPRGTLTPRPIWRSCCRSVKTPEHVCGYDPSNPPRREDTLQRPCRIASQSSQCDATTSPSKNILGYPLPGSPPLDSRSFASNDVALVLTRGRRPSSTVACPPLLLIRNPVPWTGGFGF